MLFTEKILFKEEEFTVLHLEKDNLIIDLINENKPIWKSYIGQVQATYTLTNHELILEAITLDSNLVKDEELFLGQEPEKEFEIDLENDLEKKPEKNLEKKEGQLQYKNLNTKLTYSGGIIIANGSIKTYEEQVKDPSAQQDLPCYAYEQVYELIFEDGHLKTLIDHKKAMVRIRKNIEYGLRSTDKKRDIRVINKFIKDTFSCKYTKNNRHRRIKKLIYKMKK